MATYEITTESGAVYEVVTEDAAPTGFGGGSSKGGGASTDSPRSLFSPTVDNEILSVGNAAVRGLGHAADFWDAANRNLNPLYPGGARYFGLNETPLNTPEKSPSEYIKDAAEAAYLYGPERAETTVGKLLEPGAELAASSIGPGGASNAAMKALVAPSVVGGLFNVAGADDNTTKTAELVTAIGPGLIKSGAKLTANLLGFGKVAKEAGRKVQRGALGVRESDYTRSVEELGPWVLDLPENQLASKIESTFDDLLSRNVFNGNYQPKNLVKTTIENQVKYASDIDDAVSAYAKTQKTPIVPKMSHAQKYIKSGKVINADEAESLVQSVKEQVASKGAGRLDYIQAQKVAWGDRYEIGNNSLNGLYRAIYRDLQETVERAVPKVKGLNRELQKWQVVRPIFNRAMGQDGKRNIIDWAVNALKTTGGTLTTPTVLGAIVGGGSLGAAGLVPGALLTAAASRPGRIKIGSALAALDELPNLPDRIPPGVANLLGSLQGEDGQSNDEEAPGQAQARRNSPTATDLETVAGQIAALQKETSEPLSLFNVAPESILSPAPIDDTLLDAVRYVESRGNPNAVSPAGARGAYQFMPATAKSYGVDLFDGDETDDREGARKLLMDEYGALGDLALALAAYNAGRPAVSRAIKKAGSSDFESVAPFLPQETQNYIPLIYAAIDRLKEGRA